MSGELWRAIRLVVDTGIHARGWSEMQAIDYFLKNSPAQPHLYTGSYIEYVARTGHEAPGVHA